MRLPNTKGSRTHFKNSGKATTTLVNNTNYEMAEHSPTSNEQCADDSSSGEANSNTNTYTFTRHAIRSNYMEKSIEAKRKVNLEKGSLFKIKNQNINKQNFYIVLTSNFKV